MRVFSLETGQAGAAVFSVVRQKFVEQIVAGTLKGVGRGAEAKKGVALGGAHLKMHDDDGPGLPTRASAAGAAMCRRIPDSRR